MVITRCDIHGPEENYTFCLLVPHVTLLARIQAASELAPGWQAEDEGPMDWDDWGPCGCLHLQLPQSCIVLTPFGLHMPMVVFNGDADPEPRSMSVYMFDLNPLTARFLCTTRSAQCNDTDAALQDMDLEGTALIADVNVDVEVALPGVINPECSAILYIVYHFSVPLPPEVEWHDGHAIYSMQMCMTRFVVKFYGSNGKPEGTVHIWTV
ncbi:hypothetical protein V8D89_010533 [Ganoderma adspersum]